MADSAMPGQGLGTSDGGQPSSSEQGESPNGDALEDVTPGEGNPEGGKPKEAPESVVLEDTDLDDVPDTLEPSKPVPDSKEVARKKTRDGLVDSYTKQLSDREVNWEDIPDWIQEEIQKRERAPRSPSEISERTEPTVTVDADKIAQQVEDNMTYRQMKEGLKGVKMSKVQRETLLETYKELRSNKLPKAKSLGIAVKAAGIFNDEEGKGFNAGLKLGRMSVPRPDVQPSSKDSKSNNYENMTDDQIIKKVAKRA